MYGDCVLSRERGAQRHLSFDDVAKANLLSQDPNSMVQLREKQNLSGFKHHAKVHSFRIITAILTWVLLGATLFYKPEWIRSALRKAPERSKASATRSRAIGAPKPKSSCESSGAFSGYRSRRRSSSFGSCCG